MDSFSNMCPPQIGHKSPFLPSLSKRRHYASHISLLFVHLLEFGIRYWEGTMILSYLWEQYGQRAFSFTRFRYRQIEKAMTSTMTRSRAMKWERACIRIYQQQRIVWLCICDWRRPSSSCLVYEILTDSQVIVEHAKFYHQEPTVVHQYLLTIFTPILG